MRFFVSWFLFFSILVSFTINEIALASYPTDTSQERCYGAYLTNDLEPVPCSQIGPLDTYGQDSQYTQGSKPSYRDNLNGTVTDQNTGLTWQQTPDCVRRSWQESINYCSDLELAGHSDWRLASRHDLTTILEFSLWRPVLNTVFFDNCVPNTTAFSSSWSSTSYTGNSSSAYVIDFQHGGPLGDIGSIDFKTQDHYNRCVRGETSVVSSQFVDNQDETVTDTSTGLMWQKGSQPTSTSWGDNLQYCNNLELGGYPDWRLPNIRELETLVDDTIDGPKINPIFTYHGENPSSTTIEIDPERDLLPSIFSLSFSTGGIIDSSKRNSLSARCVRNGPASEYWSTAEISEGSNLMDLYFISPEIGWAVGNEEQVFRTIDGGNTWDKLRESGAHDYEAVYFVDSNNGWVIANFYALNGRGYIFHTTDGGLTWNEQNDESSGYYKDIFFIDENIGWVIGSRGIFKTEDAGISWIDQSTELGGALRTCFLLMKQQAGLLGM